MMDITSIGCLHGELPDLPGGDLLIITGDLTGRDTLEQHSNFLEWAHKLPYTKIVMTSGNHDVFLQKNPNFFSGSRIELLCDSGTEFMGFKIWGSPWSKTFPGIHPLCMAFTRFTEHQLSEKWDLIPEDTDILITHCPPYSILDTVKDRYSGANRNVGSLSLRVKIEGFKPKLHCFSHIHEDGGKKMLLKHEGPNTLCVNCSYMNEYYKPVNEIMHIKESEWTRK